MSVSSKSHAEPARASAQGSSRLVFLCLALGLAGISQLPYPRGLASGWFQFNEYAVCSSSGIYTVDGETEKVECMRILDTRVVSTGTLDDVSIPTRIQSLLASVKLDRFTFGFDGLKVVHVPAGSIVVPGLTDSHAHVLEYGFKMNLQLDGSQSVEEVLSRLKSYIESHPDIRDDHERWIEGMGWDQTKWPHAEFPTADDFDREPLLRARPISLGRVDVHAAWVSNRVLELMGDLPEDIEGGKIVRNGNGRATGIFVDNAMSLIPSPPWSEAQMSEYFDRTMKDALSYGLTSIHEAMSLPEYVKFFKRKADAGKLPIRLYLMGHVAQTDYWGGNLTRLEDYGRDKRLQMKGIKMMSDGAIGSWGAALLEPYSDKPDATGTLLSSPESIESFIRQFHRDGWQVNIHCIGDRSNQIALDVFEDIIENQGADVESWRPRIEHAQIMTMKDLERVGRLGVIPSVQPTHATSDMWYAESRLGPERIKGAYAWKTLLNTSTNQIIALGSDFPVEGIDPLLGFYAAVSRLSTEGTSPHGEQGWYGDQRLTRAQALKGMTLDPAYASFSEHEVGSLSVGKKADFVVLDRDIMSVPFAEILKTRVLATVVDGRVAFGRLLT